MATPLKMGPCGGPGGSPWGLEGIERLTQIQIWHGDVIDAISFQYYDSKGIIQHSPKFGGPGGKQSVITLARDETLSTIMGTCRVYYGNNVVNSLFITTNHLTHGPFGTQKGMDFSLATDGRTVVGFQGTAGKFLDAIGLLLKSADMATTVKMGPCGGHGGSSWRVEGISRLTQIHIWHGRVIDAVSFQYYDSKGFLQQSPRLGGTGGNESLITLAGDEIISSIVGHCNVFNGYYVVNSLLITTNRGNYGPYGTESGMDFSLPTEGRIVTGFHGHCGLYLDAIGVLFNIPAVESKRC